jgi:spore maturation protein SpmA
VLNGVWLFLLVAAVVCGSLSGRLDAVAKASVDGTKSAVELAFGLVGIMTFWLGLVRVLENGGLLRSVARMGRPVLMRLFPGVPADHPAMGLIVMNIASNMLGLGNAATPFGLKAMIEMDKLNPHKGTATNAMAMFLAINAAGFALLPMTILALRASLGSVSPGSIVLTTLISTTISTLTAIAVGKFLENRRAFQIAAPLPDTGPATPPRTEIDTTEAAAVFERAPAEVSPNRRMLAWALIAITISAFGYGLMRHALVGFAERPAVGWSAALKDAVNNWTLVALIAGFCLFGFLKGVKVYDAIVEGGKEGFQVAIRIIPYLVTILVAVGMLRAAGGIDLLVAALQPITSLLGMPAETLPMALLRPLSGSGAYALAAETMKAHGPDSLIGNIVSTMQGSTETTFYVLALYFGVVQVRATRHTLYACLASEVAGMLAAVWTCRLLLG